jgi:class 3 adenylate cyclase
VGRNPEEVIRILNRHTSAMTHIVQAHRGVINQFAGDAIMILFGAPKSYGDDTERAVRCACAMMTERHRMNQRDAIPLQIGIGLASGSMVAGCIGAESRSDYTAVGERANLAARLCAYAAPGQIILDEETFSRVHGSYVTTPLPPLNLKGFSQPVTAYGVAVDIDGVAPGATRS